MPALAWSLHRNDTGQRREEAAELVGVGRLVAAVCRRFGKVFVEAAFADLWLFGEREDAFERDLVAGEEERLRFDRYFLLGDC